jgi:hypothetical protein
MNCHNIILGKSYSSSVLKLQRDVPPMVLEASLSLPPVFLPSSLDQLLRKPKVLVIIKGIASNTDVHIDTGMKYCSSLRNMLKGFSLGSSFGA